MAGRKPFEPTEKQRITVAAMAACGMPQDMICSQIKNPQTGKPVDTKTLRAAFRAEIKEAKTLVNAVVEQTLLKKALAGDTACLIFYLKCRAGWKEAHKVEVSGQLDVPAGLEHFYGGSTTPDPEPGT